MTGRPSRFSLRIRLQIALIAIIVGATLLATWQFSQSSGAYQDAMRQEIRRQAAMVEDIRAVYADEGPQAMRVAAAEARADGLRPIRNEGRLAASEYTLAAQTAFHLPRSARRDHLLGNGAYRYKDLGYDLPQRLADVQQRSPGLYGLTPDAQMRDGDRWAAWGTASAAGGTLAVLVAMCAANVLRPRRWQRTPTASGRRVLRRLEIIPQPATASAGHRRSALFNLLACVLPLLLPLGQILAAGGEQRAQAEAARSAVRLSASIEAHGLRTAFLTEGLRTALAAEAGALARELAVWDTGISPSDARHERVMAAVEGTIAVQIRSIAKYMGRVPVAEDRVDMTTVTALSREPKKLGAARAEQNRQVDLAEQAGRRSLLLSAATAVAVVAQILTVAAFAGGRRRWLWWPAVGVLASTALTAVAFT
ncbi:hypothetical protein DMA15_35940 [Streptomyces sp. WAC 01529]|uniref:hypothetical protein n=1 Tax=Streptomyces sp. WAC 01529 TaxID=2203205 RepID=UPI000F70FA1C|nr:hypothetical protein [Streptomyces sp. WAC 01529]AZM57289.1 hypothetical protein DMA15_35940 [Streptomyces sp. WAC 01529]